MNGLKLAAKQRETSNIYLSVISKPVVGINATAAVKIYRPPLCGEDSETRRPPCVCFCSGGWRRGWPWCARPLGGLAGHVTVRGHAHGHLTWSRGTMCETRWRKERSGVALGLLEGGGSWTFFPCGSLFPVAGIA